MTSSLSSRRSSRSRWSLFALVCCAGLALAVPSSAEWQEVELSAVRFTAPDGMDVLDLSSLTTLPPERGGLQHTNINRRLVLYGPDLPLSERRAHDLAKEAAHWFAFAETHLQDGDVLFRLGRAQTHLVMNFSAVTAVATRSRYSHSGIVRWRDGLPQAVDITASGFRAQSFPVWMREVDHHKFAIARLKPAYRDRIPQVLAFLDEQSEVRPEFDFVFEPSSERFYCNEMTEYAFRAAGVPLSEAVPSTELPGYTDIPIWSWLIEHVGKVNMSNPVYVVGNADYGMYGSDKLDIVFISSGRPVQSPDNAVVAVLPSPD